jgi:hypothetical protein
VGRLDPYGGLERLDNARVRTTCDEKSGFIAVVVYLRSHIESARTLCARHDSARTVFSRR